MNELSGWLLDLYPDSRGIVLWLLGEDGGRYCLHQLFPVTFYAAGPPQRLRLLWRYLQSQPVPVTLSRTERRDLFLPHLLPVLAVQVAEPAAQLRLFQQVSTDFPDLVYYDADISLALRYAAVHNTFPLARCRVVVDQDNLIHAIQVLDSPWELEVPAPPLRVLSLEPDSNPAHAAPQHLRLYTGRGARNATYRLSLEPARPLLVNLCAILKRHDPDLLLTTWGDTWLLPHLLALSDEYGIPLPLNRDPECKVTQRRERSYFSYGQIVYQGQQTHLFGRWHIDRRNAMLWDDYELEGVMEIARVTALPVQTAARSSPGTGISAMQMLTALRLSILIPWHKAQAETPKTALDLFAADQGGLVYQPLVGLHRDVAEIDFISMYPGIMVHFNISPETMRDRRLSAQEMASGLQRGDQPQGLVPQTLEPLLNKRLALKAQVGTLPTWDPRRAVYKARSSAHKWLLVTCFGYLGYKNARFGRIEAHEAVTAYGREALLRAKETAEDLGFTVLHLYVDGLWVKKPGAAVPADFQTLLEAIAVRTALPIALDGVYRWVAFLPSRQDARVPVANRYFGVFQDGSLKVRGIEARRRDAPPFVAETQMQLLRLFAENETDDPAARLPRAIALLRRKLSDLRGGRVPLEALLVRQKMSRELDAYHSRPPAARAAAQLQAIGKSTRAGQRVSFIYTRGEPGVHAWDLPEALDPARVDAKRYTVLLLRAASSVLDPFGTSEADLQDWMQGVRPRRPELFSGLPGERPKLSGS